jgi:hypothetical protein
VLVLELGYIVDVFIDHDPEAVALAVRRDVVFAKCLCHGVGEGVRGKRCGGEVKIEYGGKGCKVRREEKKVKSGEAGGKIYV